MLLATAGAATLEDEQRSDADCLSGRRLMACLASIDDAMVMVNSGLNLKMKRRSSIDRPTSNIPPFYSSEKNLSFFISLPIKDSQDLLFASNS